MAGGKDGILVAGEYAANKIGDCFDRRAPVLDGKVGPEPRRISVATRPCESLQHRMWQSCVFPGRAGHLRTCAGGAGPEKAPMSAAIASSGVVDRLRLQQPSAARAQIASSNCAS